MRPSGRAQLSWAQRTSVREPQLEPEMRRQSPAQRRLRAPFGRTAQSQTRNAPPDPAQRRQLSSFARTTKTIKSSGHPQPSRARGSHCRAGRPRARLPLRQFESNRRSAPALIASSVAKPFATSSVSARPSLSSENTRSNLARHLRNRTAHSVGFAEIVRLEHASYALEFARNQNGAAANENDINIARARLHAVDAVFDHFGHDGPSLLHEFRDPNRPRALGRPRLQQRPPQPRCRSR